MHNIKYIDPSKSIAQSKSNFFQIALIDQERGSYFWTGSGFIPIHPPGKIVIGTNSIVVDKAGAEREFNQALEKAECGDFFTGTLKLVELEK